MLSTDKQTDKLTDASKNITSFAKEVKKKLQETVTQHMAMHTNLMGAKNNSQ